MKRAIPWKTKMNQEEDFVSIGEPFSKHAWKAPRHHQHEDILRYVQQAPGDIRWTIDHTEFDDLFALKKDSAPGPDGIPHGTYRCAGALVRSSSFVLIKPYWREVLFLIVLLKVELSLSPGPLTSMTVEGLFDHLMHFAR